MKANYILGWKLGIWLGNLIRRDGGTCYARIYIPSDLRDQFPSEDKKVSLRTKDEAVAKRRLNFELQKWGAEFEDMRARRHLTDEDRAVAVWEHYEARLNQDAEKRRAMPTDADLKTEVAWVWQRIDRGKIRSDDVVGMISGHADFELLKRARQEDAMRLVNGRAPRASSAHSAGRIIKRHSRH